MSEPLTIEQCLKELKEMFPGKWIAFDYAENHTIGPRGKHSVESRVMAQVECTNGDLAYQSESKSVDKMMVRVRAFKQSQAKESK